MKRPSFEIHYYEILRKVDPRNDSPNICMFVHYVFHRFCWSNQTQELYNFPEYLSENSAIIFVDRMKGRPFVSACLFTKMQALGVFPLGAFKKSISVFGFTPNIVSNKKERRLIIEA